MSSLLYFWFSPAALSSQERQRRYLSLSPWDKATLSLVHLEHTHTTLHYTVHGTRLVERLDLSSCGVFVRLSGSCDSLQQDGQNYCFLLHPVPALFGLLGRFPIKPPPGGVSVCAVRFSMNTSQL